MNGINVKNVIVKVEDIIDYAKYSCENKVRFALNSKFEHEGEVHINVPMYIDYSDQGVNITCIMHDEEMMVSVPMNDFVEIEKVIKKAYETLGFGTFEFKDYRDIPEARKGCLGDYLLNEKLWKKLIEFTMESKYVAVKSKEIFDRIKIARSKEEKGNDKLLVFSTYMDKTNEKHVECRVYNKAMLRMREKSCWPVEDIGNISFDNMSDEEMQTTIEEKDFEVPYVSLDSLSFDEVVNADIDIGNVYANNTLIVIAMLGSKLGFCGDEHRREKQFESNNKFSIESTLSALMAVNNIINTRL